MINDIRVGYMDKVDFDEELGKAMRGNRVYPSIEDLRADKPCTAMCGIIRVEIRCVEVVQEDRFPNSAEFKRE